MAWLVADKNGDELIFDRKPVKSNLFKGRWDRNSYGGLFSSIELPKGTIETLIGRKLTWDDEPVVLVEKMIKSVGPLPEGISLSLSDGRYTAFDENGNEVNLNDDLTEIIK